LPESAIVAIGDVLSLTVSTGDWVWVQLLGRFQGAASSPGRLRNRQKVKGLVLSQRSLKVGSVNLPEWALRHIAQYCVIFITATPVFQRERRESRSEAGRDRLGIAAILLDRLEQLPDSPPQRFLRERFLDKRHVRLQQRILGNNSGCVSRHEQHL
jgi:hypothetical protein